MTTGVVRICDNLADVRARIEQAAHASGRDPASVRLVAISKEQPADAVAAALGCGQLDVGENRAQELVAKARALEATAPRPIWHFVGRLQRNKVRVLAPFVSRWHSIDRGELVADLARYAPDVPMLVQVNVAGEPQKGGCAPEDAGPLVARCREAGLAVDGLMTVPPLGVDARPYFRVLRALAARLELPELSMGMTGDFEAAVAEGATYVRVGSAVFGPRTGVGGLRR
jgi:pyridoxal phosphate enzyme (YggS family)